MLTPDQLLQAYRIGLFPMAESREARTLSWYDPPMRGVLPLNAFHLSRRLRRTVLTGPLQVTADCRFAEVIAACAASTEGREQSWINPEIERLFTELHRRGYAHSIECNLEGELVGGLYGVAIGGAFFGESMFSRVRDASKVALVQLVSRLRLGGYTLLDTQFTTPHLAQFGGYEITRMRYRRALQQALTQPAHWITVLPEGGLASMIKDANLGFDREATSGD